jgi:hypothetical protein
MRARRAVIGILLLASQPAFADIKRHELVPVALRGSWAPSSDACAPGDKSKVVLAAKAYTTAELKCMVDWVSETASPHGANYSVRMRCTEEGAGKPPSVVNLIIRSDNAKQISLGPAFDNLKAYQKCSD